MLLRLCGGTFTPTPPRANGRWRRSCKCGSNEIGEVVQRGRSLPQSLAALKSAIAAQGLCSPAVLPPLLPCEAEERHAIWEELRGLGLA
jgi:hypothetical protein